MSRVIKRIGTDASLQQLAGKVSASSPPETVLLNIKVSDTSPGAAQRIANAIADVFPAVIEEVEAPATGNGSSSPVKVSVTQRAALPSSAASPRLSTYIVLGIACGLVLAWGTAIIRARFDRKLRDSQSAAEVAGAAVLGSLSHDAELRERPIFVEDKRLRSRNEEIRHIRTNIRFLSFDGELTSLAITSSVPGEGKSTIAANLALSMASAGQQVVLIDGDMRRPRVAPMFGLPREVGLTNVLLGEMSVFDALHLWREDLNLWVLASGPIPPNPSELLGSDRLASAIGMLVDRGYLVLIDCPPLLPVTDASIIARATGGAVLVARVGETEPKNLAAAAAAVRAVEGKVLGVVVNGTPKRTGSYDGYELASRKGRRG